MKFMQGLCQTLVVLPIEPVKQSQKVYPLDYINLQQMIGKSLSC